MKKLIIIGAGGFGRETAALVRDINKESPQWEFLGFIDDDVNKPVPEGYPVLGDLDYLISMPERPDVSIAIANAETRERIVTKLKGYGFRFPTLIHPSVAIGPDVRFGEGCIICRGGIYTTNITIGNFVISNLGTTYGHDTRVEDYVSLMSHTSIAGDVLIGKACYFGLHCTVINMVSITDHCVFGAGAAVVKDITEPGTYVGVPARKIK